MSSVWKVTSSNNCLLQVCSLQPPYSERMAVTRPLNMRGGRDSSSLVGLGLLAYSRLLVLASEDGQVKICC